jgi:CBS domain-containing protein
LTRRRNTLTTKEPDDIAHPLELSDDDIYEAMRELTGYVDITTGDFREIYRSAYVHAVERLSRAAPARDLMTREVVSVHPDTRLSEVAKTMASHGTEAHSISGVPVLEDSRVVGVLSEKDFLRALGVTRIKTFMGFLAHYLDHRGSDLLDLGEKRAGEIMTSPAITVDEETPVAEIARIFKEKHINRVPVTDQSGRLVGIVSRADLVGSL